MREETRSTLTDLEKAFAPLHRGRERFPIIRPKAKASLNYPVETRIRPMREADIRFVLAIQAESYPLTHIESEAVFRLRLDSAPHTAWVAEDCGNVMAYLVAYPSLYGTITPLGAVFSIPALPDCLYLHDLALSPKARGRGLAGRLIRHAWQTAGRFGLEVSALVSVQGSHDFWSGMGYRISSLVDPAQQSHLETYAGSGWYMARSLAPVAP